ncbi:MAG: hypothetical protein ACOCUI_03720 [bacterium]
MEEYIDNILEIIEDIERTSSDKNKIYRNSLNTGKKDIVQMLKLLVDLFKKTDESVKDKFDFILEYNDKYDMGTLLEIIGIDFGDFNSIISGNADNDLIEKVDSKLSSIIGKMTEVIKSKSKTGNKEKELCFRNSNLEEEASEFSDRLYKSLYSKDK